MARRRSKLLNRSLRALLVLTLFLAYRWFVYSPSETPPAWKLTQTRYAGLGLTASRLIRQGDLILQERPLVKLSPLWSVDGRPPSLEQVVAILSSQLLQNYELERQYYELTSVHEHVPLIYGIHETNAIKLNDEDGTGVFRNTSRINHSCLPNAVYHYDKSSNRLSVRSLRRIKKNEEIFISYIPFNQPRAQRQLQLSNSFKFTCTCSKCSLSIALSKLSDERIEKINYLRHSLTSTWGAGSIGPRQALSLVKQIWVLMLEESVEPQKGLIAEDAVNICLSAGDKTCAKEWAVLARGWWRVEIGETGANMERLKRISEGILEGDSVWKSREQAKGLPLPDRGWKPGFY